ncbi:MAG: ABC transporter permease [Phycisphaerales bacterium JB058]
MNEDNQPAAQPRVSLARRLAGAQEAGLVFVIILMGTALALLGGNKQKQFRINLPEGASVVEYNAEGTETEPGTISLQQVVGWRVSSNEGEQTYERASGYSFNANQNAFFGRRTVNKFLDSENLVLVAKDASFIAIMAVGMTAVIILAGIDLSVGSIYGLSALIGAMALRKFTGDDTGLFLSLPIGVGICCLVGLACGAANGIMIVGLRVHPFVITLGTMAAYRGLIFVISGGQSVGNFPDSFTSGFFKAEVAGTYPVPVLVMLLAGAVGMFLLAKTVVGRQVYAIGGNETAAKYAGIPVGRVKIIVYSMLGLLAGLSAAVYLGYLGAAEPNAGMTYELKVIAATVIGGASLMGGRGSAVGAVLGAIVIQLIDNGMIILEIDQSYNQIVMGVAIIIAVVIDQAKARLAPKG